MMGFIEGQLYIVADGVSNGGQASRQKKAFNSCGQRRDGGGVNVGEVDERKTTKINYDRTSMRCSGLSASIIAGTALSIRSVFTL